MSVRTTFFCMLCCILGCVLYPTSSSHSQQSRLSSKVLFPSSLPPLHFPGKQAKPGDILDPKDCQTGCQASGKSKALSQEKFLAFVDTFSRQKLGEESKALEHLLFYQQQTMKFLQKQGQVALPKSHHTYLLKELKKTHMKLSLRFIDEKGVVRILVKPKRLALGKHFHLEADETKNVQTPHFGGKSKRVGLHHIWVRI